MNVDVMALEVGGQTPSMVERPVVLAQHGGTATGTIRVDVSGPRHAMLLDPAAVR